MQRLKITMKNKLTPIIVSTLMLACCSHYECDNIETDQTQISVDGKIRVEIGSKGNALKYKITNVSSEEIGIDKEMVFFSDISLVGRDCKRIIPSVIYDKDVHKNIRCVESYFDEEFDASKVDLSSAIAKLNPGESLCKIYYSNQFIHAHQLVISFDGTSSINRYSWKLPSLSEIQKATLVYNGNSWNADILTIIANSTNQSVPENLYQGKIQIDWENK